MMSKLKLGTGYFNFPAIEANLLAIGLIKHLYNFVSQQEEKKKMFVLKHGFIINYTAYTHLNQVVEKEVNAFIDQVARAPNILLHQYNMRRNVMDVATFPDFTNDVVNFLAPERLRHVLYNNPNHTFRRKEFNVKLFEAVTGEFHHFLMLLVGS
jgi:hypothetical protein